MNFKLLILTGLSLATVPALAFKDVIQCTNYVTEDCFYDPYDFRDWICQEENLPRGPENVPYTRVQKLELSVYEDSVHAIESVYDKTGKLISEKPLVEELTGMTCINGASDCESRDRMSGIYLKVREDRETLRDYYELILRKEGKNKVVGTFDYCE